MSNKVKKVSGNLAKNTLLLSLGTLLNKGLQFVMIPLFSRWLSTEDYGNFDLLSTYITLLIPIITLACSEAIFRFGIETDKDEHKSIYITNGLFIVILNSIILGIIIIGVKSVFGFSYAFAFFILAFGEVFNQYLQGYLRSIRKLNIYSFCSAITTVFIAIAVTIFVRIFGWNLHGMILGYGCGYILGDLSIIIITRFSKYLNFKNIHLKHIKRMVQYSYPLIPNNISWWVINVSDRTIIKLFLGAASNGVYAIAYKIPNLCSAIFSVFNISWQETATDMVDSDERNIYYNQVYNQMLACLISLCGGVLSLNFFLFNYIFDLRYIDAHLYTPILISSLIFSSLSQFFGGIQISLKQPKANGFSTIIGAVANLIIHFILVKNMGLYAAAISTLAANLIVVLIRRILLKKIVVFKLSKRQYIYISIYIYLVLMSFNIENFYINIFNLLLSCTMFVIINIKIVMNMLKKVIKR